MQADGWWTLFSTLLNIQTPRFARSFGDSPLLFLLYFFLFVLFFFSTSFRRHDRRRHAYTFVSPLIYPPSDSVRVLKQTRRRDATLLYRPAPPPPFVLLRRPPSHHAVPVFVRTALSTYLPTYLPTYLLLSTWPDHAFSPFLETCVHYAGVENTRDECIYIYIYIYI